MNDETKVQTKRGRGKGKKPAMAFTNLRLQSQILEYYKSFPNYTTVMRDVLTNYANEHIGENK